MTSSKIFYILNWSIIIGMLIFGNLNYLNKPSDSMPLAAYYNKSLTFTGWVCEEADEGLNSRRLTVCIRLPKSSQQTVVSRLLVTTSLYPTYEYGDFLQIKGRVIKPQSIKGFDYEAYLERYDIYALVSYPKIELRSGILNAKQKMYLKLLRVKWYLRDVINSGLKEPEAGLATALLLGYRRTIDREDAQIFSRVGLSHLIAISGSHLTILSALLVNLGLFLGLSRRRIFWPVISFLILYPLITGLSASAVRAAIMGGLTFFGIYFGRVSLIKRALVFSAAIMLLFNPLLLRADIGFQLSFLAMLGIIYIYPVAENLSYKILANFSIKPRRRRAIEAIFSIVNLTLVSQIITLPVLLINFQSLSLISPLANVALVWTFPWLLSFLLIGIFLSSLLPGAAPLWFLPAWLLLRLVFAVSRFLANFSWSAVAINNFTWFEGVIYYLVLYIILKLFKRVLKLSPTKTAKPF